MIVHTTADIERELRFGRTPQTDNRSALIALGFEPAMPHLRDDSTWIRPVEKTPVDFSGRRTRAVRRVLALERAVFVALAEKTPHSRRSAPYYRSGTGSEKF
jgi:hypothetical protein